MGQEMKYMKPRVLGYIKKHNPIHFTISGDLEWMLRIIENGVDNAIS
jgi:hypothetical protein